MSPPVTADLVAAAGAALADAQAAIDQRAAQAAEQLPPSTPPPTADQKPQEPTNGRSPS